MDMTMIDLHVYAADLMGNFLAAMTIYFSVITIYVVAAFTSGSRLSKVQLLILNVCYSIAALIFGVLSVAIFSRFFEIASRATVESDAVAPVDFRIPLIFLTIVVYIGSLIFMWTVRKTTDVEMTLS